MSLFRRRNHAIVFSPPDSLPKRAWRVALPVLAVAVLAACVESDSKSSSSSNSDNTQQSRAWFGPLNDTGTTLCGNQVDDPDTSELDIFEEGALDQFYADYAADPKHDNAIDCSDAMATATQSGVDRNGVLVPAAQDAHIGRDAQAAAGLLIKIGAGAAGFDFTKLGADGHALAIQNGTWSDSGSEAAGTRWSCVRDNHTGLVWEVKRNDVSSLHHKDHTFTWYNPDGSTNDGWEGTPSEGECGNTVAGGCDTQKFVAAVNAQGLCGANDWRLPRSGELTSILHHGRLNPAIDTGYFPNAGSGEDNWYWSSESYMTIKWGAWGVDFSTGRIHWRFKRVPIGVRLVRVGN